MNKKIIYGIIGLVVVASLFFLFTKSKVENEEVSQKDYKNTEYTIDGQKVMLVGGVSETPAAPGSASVVTTQYFGNEVRADLNKDGREDVVFLVTQNNGGSGTFYYVVASLNTADGYVGSEGLLLGDRIAPQTTEMSKNPSHDNVIIVNYADRKAGEAFTVSPSVGKSIWLKLDVDSMQFGQVEQNFEGEADPKKMSLTMKNWTWVRVVYNDGKVVTPNKSEAFSISFKNDGTFIATTDCNSAGGNYSTTEGNIKFTNTISTLAFCEGSQEQVFIGLLTASQAYSFTSKGEMVLDLKLDSGSVVFK
ncbi:MAG: META domain-containing protein [Patescibacteria group bacterium]